MQGDNYSDDDAKSDLVESYLDEYLESKDIIVAGVQIDAERVNSEIEYETYDVIKLHVEGKHDEAIELILEVINEVVRRLILDALASD